MNARPHRFLAAGDAALIVEFGNAIDRDLSAEVLGFDRRVHDTPPAGFITSIPTFRSVTIQFDPLQTEPAAVQSHLEALLRQGGPKVETRPTLWRIPVCYDPQMGPDLAEIGRRTGISARAYTRRHAAQEYFVYMVGGFPGYPHMGDLEPAMRVPRLQSPRTRVPPGSVAVAGKLTAIYPMPTPGGWCLIGRTPVRLFEAARDAPALLAPGDRVRFEPIERDAFDRLAAAVEAGSFDHQTMKAAR